MPENKKNQIKALNQIEVKYKIKDIYIKKWEKEKLMRDLEEEQRKLEIEYDKILQNIFEKRDKKIKEAKSYPDFWLRVLSNHSVTKDFIN